MIYASVRPGAKACGEMANKPVEGGGAGADSVVLEEEIDPNYVPSEAEVVEYAKWLGMDLKSDADLFWVAKEGLMAPLPKNWKPCKTKDTEDIYYFNFSTGDSTWDHPCDGYYKRLYEEEKKKKEIVIKVIHYFLEQVLKLYLLIICFYRKALIKIVVELNLMLISY